MTRRIGLIGGAAVGVYAATFDEPRTLPVMILAGGGLGAFIDALRR